MYVYVLVWLCCVAAALFFVALHFVVCFGFFVDDVGGFGAFFDGGSFEFCAHESAAFVGAHVFGNFCAFLFDVAHTFGRRGDEVLHFSDDGFFLIDIAFGEAIVLLVQIGDGAPELADAVGGFLDESGFRDDAGGCYRRGGGRRGGAIGRGGLFAGGEGCSGCEKKGNCSQWIFGIGIIGV